MHDITSRSGQPLVNYTAARTALDKACRVDEVQKIKDKAQQWKLYAKQAKDKKLLLDAQIIMERAVRKVGQLMKAQKATMGLAKAGRPSKKIGLKGNPISVPTLAEAGIDKNLADRGRKLAAFNDEEFEVKIETWRDNAMAGSGFAVGDMLKGPVHGTQGTGNDEWYTPQEDIDKAREVLGAIDLDPASCAIAQRTVKAENYFNAKHDGLKQDWRGKVWLNPPYSYPLIEKFVSKITSEVAAEHVTEAIMLTLNHTDTAWFQDAVSAAAVICFTRGRVRFVDPEGNQVKSPIQGNAFFYFGRNVKRFCQVFKEVGFIVKPL